MVTSLKKCAPITIRDAATKIVNMNPPIKKLLPLPLNFGNTKGNTLNRIAHAALPECPEGNDLNSSAATPMAVRCSFIVLPITHHGWKAASEFIAINRILGLPQGIFTILIKINSANTAVISNIAKNGKIIVPNYLIHQVYCLRLFPYFTYIQGEDFLT